jgi:hypothetical protein
VLCTIYERIAHVEIPHNHDECVVPVLVDQRLHLNCVGVCPDPASAYGLPPSLAAHQKAARMLSPIRMKGMCFYTDEIPNVWVRCHIGDGGHLAKLKCISRYMVRYVSQQSNVKALVCISSSCVAHAMAI